MPSFFHPLGLDVFDDVDPIDTKLLDDCVHCGFCLPACPTYLLYGDEMDSPRGRIYLMGQLANGAAVTKAATTHLDRCLGCFACVTACPSGVHYDTLLESTRSQLERHGVRTIRQAGERAALFSLFPYKHRLRPAAALLRALDTVGLGKLMRSSSIVEKLPGLAGAALAVAPDATPRVEVAVLTRAHGASRGRVGLLTGCVQETFFSNVNAATVTVLSAEGYDVIAPERQGCCGALSAHAGRLDEARNFARALIDIFEATGVSTIVVNSAGCGSSMKNYAHLLADDPQYREAAARFSRATCDVTELLADSPSVAPRHPLDIAVAYHDACHLCHGQGIRDQPRQLLREIPGLQLVEIGDGEACCGSAGIYNLVEPKAARRIGAVKAERIRASHPDLVASGNPGCNLQITSALRGSGTEIPVRHTIEILAASIADQRSASLLKPPGSGLGSFKNVLGRILSGTKAKQ
jgi:glycolate oxidase iron-sulfur subunit